jgi:hypothetical protein
MLAMRAPAPIPAPPAVRPRLDLSGPRLVQAFEALVAVTDDSGGIERYIDALKVKSELFARALGEGRARDVAATEFRTLCAWMPTVRRRIGAHVEPERFDRLRGLVGALFDERHGTNDADARIEAFCAAFPRDRAHRWVRDLATELLHQADPERYPAMTRWLWDAGTNTGVLREIWHGDDVHHRPIEIEDRYETFVVLREELAQFLAGQGVFRDVLFYVDLLAARVYADYIQEQGGSYLRADFSNAEEPMVHVRRLLGLDGVAEDGRTRLKAADGTAVMIDDPLDPALLPRTRHPG